MADVAAAGRPVPGHRLQPLRRPAPPRRRRPRRASPTEFVAASRGRGRCAAAPWPARSARPPCSSTATPATGATPSADPAPRSTCSPPCCSACGPSRCSRLGRRSGSRCLAAAEARGEVRAGLDRRRAGEWIVRLAALVRGDAVGRRSTSTTTAPSAPSSAPTSSAASPHDRPDTEEATP